MDGISGAEIFKHVYQRNLAYAVHIGKLVKKALKAGYKAGIYSDYSKDVIRPSAQECAQNGRARSTKMRWAVRAE